MTPQQFKDTLADLGLSQAGLARLLGANNVTTNRWAMGVVPIPHSIVLLLAAWRSHPDLIRKAAQQ